VAAATLDQQARTRRRARTSLRLATTATTPSRVWRTRRQPSPTVVSPRTVARARTAPDPTRRRTRPTPLRPTPREVHPRRARTCGVLMWRRRPSGTRLSLVARAMPVSSAMSPGAARTSRQRATCRVRYPPAHLHEHVPYACRLRSHAFASERTPLRLPGRLRQGLHSPVRPAPA
jgi:hypothetical protein